VSAEQYRNIVNDGEQGRTDYTVHVVDRLTGFEGQSTPPLGHGEPEFPELAELLTQFASPFQHRRPARARSAGRIFTRPRPTSLAPRPAW